MHGYGILRVVEELSAGSVRLAVGTLYGALERLESEGAIVEDRQEVENGRLRRYYRLTDHGREVLSTEMAVLEADVRAARRSLASHSVIPAVGGSA
jgi:DNA-binding PadR family transcriptional regulator